MFPTQNTATFLETTAKKEFTPLARRGFLGIETRFCQN
jgi:hypothetical protein